MKQSLHYNSIQVKYLHFAFLTFIFEKLATDFAYNLKENMLYRWLK
ncbi:MAG: hypothetical protein MUC29_10625 [Pyrinomonadaceae bacterium]|nr:hypothetical protein [Pyrinomonadaceae bacterium]